MPCLVLSACRVDVTTTLTVDEDGSGTVVVDAVADADLVGRVPGLADELRLDDLTASGWTVDGPTPTDDGGLALALRHDFAGPEEATALLAQLNGPRGPYQDLAVVRTVDPAADTVTVQVTGRLGVDGGLQALLDDKALEVVGGVPFADEVSDGAVSDVFGARLVVALPDEEGRTPPVTFGEDGMTDAQVVTLSPDGAAIPVDVTSIVDTSTGRRAPLVALVAGVALVAWLVLSVSFAVYVLGSRRRRAAARLARLDQRA